MRKKDRPDIIYDIKYDVNISSCTRDIVSTIYYIRNLNFQKANLGDTQRFRFIFDTTEMVINNN